MPERYLERFGVLGLELVASGRNLGLLTRYGGADPELNAIGREATGNQLANNFLSGVDAWGFALPRTVTLSARIDF